MKILVEKIERLQQGNFQFIDLKDKGNQDGSKEGKGPCTHTRGHLKKVVDQLLKDLHDIKKLSQEASKREV